MRILVLDDEPVARLVLERAVTKLGHRATVAAGADEAFALVCSHGIDVVISDWVMPGMDGPELCRRVRAYTGHTTLGGHTPYT